MERDRVYRVIIRKRVLIYLLLALGAGIAGIILLPFKAVKMGVAALILVPFILIIVERPVLAFYLMIFTLFSSVYLIIPIPLIKLLVLVTAAAMAVMIFRRWIPFIHDRFFLLLLFIFILVVFQSLITVRDTASYFYRLDNLVKNIIILLIATQFVRNRREFRRFLLVIIMGFVVMNYLPLLRPATGESSGVSGAILVEQAVFRYGGYIREPNFLGFNQFFLMPLLLFLASIRRTGRMARVALTMLFLGSIAVIIITFSRGAFLTLLFMLLLLLIIERRNKLILYSGLAVIAAGAFIAPVVYWDRISSIFRLSSYITEDYAIMSRVITMKVAVILGMKNPLFGVGLENFLYHAARYTSFGYVVHNSLLQVFSEMGFPGLLIIISIIIYNFRLISRLARDRTDKERARLGRFLLLQQMSVLFCSMTLPVAYDYLFWSALFMPSIAAYAYKARDKAASRV
ncbi:MAG: hypothetical protein GF417_13760 [Candidatus Latescibacteria bacterium]|nr:hypothetical protein [bacterium]MBD3425496.1 hypothetical protein [Candidatus Latescibacterota bacterium]